MSNTQIIDGLNDLLKKNNDAAHGYSNVAQKTDNNVLRHFYWSKFSLRKLYSNQIKLLLKQLDAKIDDERSVAGSIHNGWINFKNLFVVDKEEAILEEVIRGEQNSLNAYNDFLNLDNIPHDIYGTISFQKENIKEALERAETLEEVH